ncbi:hypothetical protein NDU88_001276 [Pleurodeles waltl]|uniref:Uncharacterized protein n=1 Tax=Pleurodeles waltl TaxID=8319 RepID=A0AAV7LAT3_PLEWA|nr:hypothetical protein NDU88_001276 [Pleurodeles waltl]
MLAVHKQSVGPRRGPSPLGTCRYSLILGRSALAAQQDEPILGCRGNAQDGASMSWTSPGSPRRPRTGCLPRRESAGRGSRVPARNDLDPVSGPKSIGALVVLQHPRPR